MAKKRYLSLLLPLLLFFVGAPAEAEFICSGSDCEKINQNYGYYFNDFQSKYLPLVTKDILVSQALSNATGIPYHVNLSRFTLGVYGTVAVTEQDFVTLSNDQTGETKRLPERGFALGGGWYAGVNVGWLFTAWYSTYYDWFKCPENQKCNSQHTFPVLSRIDVYANGVGNYNNNASYNDPKKPLRRFDGIGWAVRVHAINEYKIFGDVLSFSGLSIGGGYYKSRNQFRTLLDDKLKLSITEFTFYEWNGRNRIEYFTETKTSYGDIRTGIRLLDFFEVYGGVGMSVTKGMSHLAFERTAVIITPTHQTFYSVKFNSTANDTVKMVHGLAGLNVGPFTIQGARTMKKNILTNKHVFAGTLAFTFDY